MTAMAHQVSSDSRNVQESFLVLLPQIERHARIYFRQIACPGLRSDRVAETVGLAWKWHCRLLEQGKDVLAFPVVFSCMVARAVKSGRRLCGQEKAADAMSSVAQQRRSFTVSSLPQGSSLEGNVFDEALRDNTQSAVPDQAAFRSDFRDWLKSLPRRNRDIVRQLAFGHTTTEVASRFGVSAGRISQLRQQFHDDWREFCDPVQQKESPPS
jgi:DNA-directed RNA polymerase specialized sigma24 family protein